MVFEYVFCKHFNLLLCLVLNLKLKNEDVQLVGDSNVLKAGEKKGITFDWVPPNVSSDLVS